ncbi:LLM class flavin-dependent oxidoreductase [Cellulomonas sp. ATA003]|uniref:LLM class flavin-dependent oxidoreductase n=1 Tax=Cellulomonas sp. ATA003 TaxID=3073064 RepID=UPI0037C13B7F
MTTDGLRFGIVLLPQDRWVHARERWQRAEAMGFDHAWTYDHLAWRTLVDEPWFATVPLLAAAATATQRIRLGTWVASPNYRHPVPFAKDVMGLDDISGGRLLLGLGAGGPAGTRASSARRRASPSARAGSPSSPSCWTRCSPSRSPSTPGSSTPRTAPG